MLERLIESTDKSVQSRKMRTYLFSVGTLVSTLFVCGLIVSIFGTNLAMGPASIELSTLAAPALIPEIVPPKPEPNKSDDAAKPSSVVRRPQRAKNIQRPDESPVAVPKTVSVAPSKFKARPKSTFILSEAGDSDGAGGKSIDPRAANSGGPGGFGTGETTPEVDNDKSTTTVKKALPAPPTLPKDVVASGGVVNGKAKRLVMPVVSASAKAVGARGTVKVKVLISETGHVLSANSVSGHALLRPLAVNAALKSTFTPTYLSTVPVKVSGVIIYNFR